MRAALVLALVATAGAEAADWPTDLPETPVPAWPAVELKRILVVPDIHGDLEQGIRALMAGGLIDTTGACILGAGDVAIFLGDLADRGPKSLELYDLVDQLVAAAAARGARVLRLVGNHEMMLLSADLRYVNKEELNAAGGREAFAALFQPGGRYNDMIRSKFFPLALLNGTLFVHAGYSPDFAYPAAELGEFALASLRQKQNENHDLWGERGLVWYRGLVYDADRCAQLDEILAAAGARRLVVGHTPQEAIRTDCGGKFVLVDHGMSRWIDGRAAGVLEIRGDDVHAVYAGGERQVLV